MLQVTMDVFSGRPNPSWIITDEQEVRAVLNELANNRTAMTEAVPSEAGLGLRGVVVEPISDELGRDFDVPASMYIPVGPNSASNAIIDRLISLVSQPNLAFSIESEGLTVETEFLSYLQQQRVESTRGTSVDVEELLGGPGEAAPEAMAVTCYIENYAYNPAFWNNDTTIRQSNNCYNYASNKRTNTFAQPGRGCGKIYTAITCKEVTRAALCDGLHRRYDCFPASEAPRHLVALVVAPGPGFIDFHWYRKMREGFWGHKPGGTAVRNVDNSNKVIYDPRYCDRGPYTQFCGFFYTCKSQKIR